MATRLERLLKKARKSVDKSKIDQALKYYRDACERAGNEPAVWRERGQVAADAGRKPEAAEAFFHLADMYARAGQTAEAMEAAETVLSLDPEHGGARRFVRMLAPRLARARNTHDDDVVIEAEPASATERRGPRADTDSYLGAEAAAALAAEDEDDPSVAAAAEPPPRPSPASGGGVSVEAAARGAVVPDGAFEAEADPDSDPESDHDLESDREPEQERAPEHAHEHEHEPEPEPEPEHEDADEHEHEHEHAHEHEDAHEPEHEHEDEHAHEPAHAARSGGGNGVPAVSNRGAGNQAPPAERRIGRITGRIALDELTLAGLTDEADDTAELTLARGDDDRTGVVQAVAATVGSSPFLSELDSDLVRYLIDAGRMRLCPRGKAVFMEGEEGASLYLVLRGAVDVERADGGASVTLATLRPGAFFGEMALLTDAPRSATVRARADATLLEVSREAVVALLEREPRVLELLLRFFRARLVGTLVATSPLFSGFSADERRQLVTRFRLRELPEGYRVLERGAPGDGLHLVLVGEFEALVPGDNGSPKTLGAIGPGDVFGEMSLLDDAEAMADIRCASRAWVLRLPRSDFDEVARSHPEMRAQLAAIARDRRERNVTAISGGVPV